MSAPDREEIIEPLFLVPSSAPLWGSREVARLIADHTLSAETALRQVYRFAASRWIPVAANRARGTREPANLFDMKAVAAAKVLSVLTDLGIEDHATMLAASLPLYAWNDDQPIIAKSGSPLMAAMLRGETHDEWWVYQLRLSRGDQDGRRAIRAWVYNPDTWSPSAEAEDPQMLPRAGVTVHLTPLLKPLFRRLKESIGATPADVRAN
jgi:hypothetical protein